MLTDVYLELDRLLGRKVFRPTKTQSRMDLAAIEGCKTKKCLGALRTLWRSSGDKGHNDRITHLKSFLVVSPGRARHEREEEHEEEPVVPVEDDDQGAEGERPVNEGLEEEGQSEAGEEESDESGGEVVEDSKDDVAPTSQDDDGSASQNSGSHLNSPTLRLDDCHHDGEVDSVSDASSVTSEESMPQDSQVAGAGWMGRAMMAARPLERQEKQEEKKRDRIDKIIGDIRLELSAQCRGEYADLEVSWDTYKHFCFDAIRTHGEDVCEKLASREFFFKWLRGQKATPAQAGL